MAYLNGSGLSGVSGDLTSLLQVVFTKGIMLQINEEFADWENVSKLKVDNKNPRSIAYMLQKSLGSTAVQPAGSGRITLPKAQEVSLEECEAVLKRMYSTIEVNYDLWKDAMTTPEKYAEPLALEIESKSIAQKRYLSNVFHRDGSGVVGTVASVAGSVVTFEDSPVIGGQGARHVEFEEQYAVVEATGAGAVNASKGVVQISDKERNDGKNEATIVVVSGSIEAGDVLCKLGAPVDAAYASGAGTFAKPSGELSQLSNEVGGIYAVANDDGSTYNGVKFEGSLKATNVDAGGALIDLDHIQRVMDKLRVRVGSKYKYNQMLMSPEVNRTFLQSQESDRRLVSISDTDRGFKSFGFIHGSDHLACEVSEFAWSNKIKLIPSDAKGAGVLQLHGSEFQEVKAGASSEFLANGADGYETAIQKFMYGYLGLICRHPAAVAGIENFTTL